MQTDRLTLAAVPALPVALVTAMVLSAPAMAEEEPGSAPGLAGFGLGAVLGAVVAGPPGALLGALGGSLAGDGWQSREAELDASEAERVAMAQELAALREAYAGALVAVSHGELDAAELPVAGLSLDLYFRSGSDVIDDRAAATLERFAALLAAHPESTILITGHADARGPEHYNRDLSARRIASVSKALFDAGLESGRATLRAEGETHARAAGGDFDGYALDRRVNITIISDRGI